MSKILRRPMFRGGGKVSSYGNGIESGMGYAGGGRVGYQTGGNILSNISLPVLTLALTPLSKYLIPVSKALFTS